MATICIDFDGTIVEENRYPDKPAILPGAIEAIQKLKDAGFYISIYSCRNNPDIRSYRGRHQQMMDLLKEYKVPYDDIILDPKPIADYYIDDRAIHFTNWKDVLNQIEELKDGNS